MRDAAIAAMQGAQEITPEQAADRAGGLIGAVVQTVLSAPDAAARGGFILREQLQPTSAFEVLHQGFVRELHEALTVLVARATGNVADEAKTIVCAHALLGQALIFGMARETLARRLSKHRLEAADLDLILPVVAQLASAALSGLREDMP